MQNLDLLREPLPKGWEARIDPRTNKVYYRDTIEKHTSWSKPEPSSDRPMVFQQVSQSQFNSALPSGWDSRVDPRTGRIYFRNLSDKTTSWSKPTQPAAGGAPNSSNSSSTSSQQASSSSSNSHLFAQPASSSRRRSSANPNDEAILEATYKGLLQGMLANNSISVAELQRLETFRTKHSWNMSQHNNCLADLGYTTEQFDATKNLDDGDDNSDRECVVCMTNTINCVFLPCGHLKTCMECAHKLNNCPICRQKIGTRQKVFT